MKLNKKSSFLKCCKLIRITTVTCNKIFLIGLFFSYTAFAFANSMQSEKLVNQISESKSVTGSNIFARHYHLDKKLIYHMKGINQNGKNVRRYSVEAVGKVKKDAAGIFYEEYKWRNLIVNGKPEILTPLSKKFRQFVSLESGYKLSVPGLGKVQQNLIGPIVDFLTFYADLRLAMQQQGLVHPGDHVYVKDGKPNSWADGHRVLLGQDAIDFDIKLKSINAGNHTAELIIRHVPPSKPEVKLPAAWMHIPVKNTPNNWVQVVKMPGGKYYASVGKEIFDVQMKVSLLSGKILSASLDNKVYTENRICSDSKLLDAGRPNYGTIIRKIEIY